MSTAIQTLERDVELYTMDDLPESDGKPMAETPEHTLQIVAAFNALLWHFRGDSQMYVMGNMFVYFLNVIGKLKRVAPDIFAVRGVSKEKRRIYSVEKEGKAPEMVIEFTSKKTKKIDLFKKPQIYSWLGVSEYFMFDPLGDYLKPRLIGFELVGGKYLRMDITQPRLRSKVLGLDLVAEGDNLRFYDPRTGERLLTHAEAQTARQIAEEQMQREAAARQAAEAELARLREELARLQKKDE
jgi:Uma2 family endonuclease